MFSTKIRTFIIAIVASAGFAVASAVPAVSQAQWHNICYQGHCTEHANYTYENPCNSTAAALSPEAQKAEEEKRKKEEEEGKIHQEEVEKSFYGCDTASPSTSGGSSGGTSTGTTTVSPVRILTAPVVMPVL